MTTGAATVLGSAPEQHSRRCALAKSAIESKRWPAAACTLRTAATLAQEWADHARSLANWCDTMAKNGCAHFAAADVLPAEPQTTALEPAYNPSLEALEAGLMALAHGLGRVHAARARRAMNGVLAAASTSAAATLPAEAAMIGATLDGSSLEQGEPA